MVAIAPEVISMNVVLATADSQTQGLLGFMLSSVAFVRVIAWPQSAASLLAEPALASADLVMVDVALPGSGAVELQIALRAMCPRSVHVVYMPAYDPCVNLALLNAGANLVIDPFTGAGSLARLLGWGSPSIRKNSLAPCPPKCAGVGAWGISEGLIDAIPVPLVFKDDIGRIVAVNSQMEHLMGVGRELVIGRFPHEVCQEQAVGPVHDHEAIGQGGQGVSAFETDTVVGDGSLRRLQHRRSPLPSPTGNASGIVALALDITEISQAHDRLRQRELRLAEAVRATTDVSWTWDPVADRVDVEAGWEIGALHQPTRAAGLAEFTMFVHPSDRAAVAQAMRSCADGTRARFELEARCALDGVSWRSYRIRGVGKPGVSPPRRVVGVATDIQEVVEARMQARHARSHDLLTGLPNRTELVEHLQWLLGQASDLRGSLLVFSVDRLHIVEDAHGPAVADAVVADTAARLAAAIGPSGALWSVGGYQFATFVPEDGPGGSPSQRASAIQRLAGDNPVASAVGGVPVSLSVAIAPLGAEWDSPEAVLGACRRLIRSARAVGRGQILVADRGASTKCHRAFIIERDLASAILRQDLEVHYQPIVGLATGQIGGFEALLRWTHPEIGRVGPDEFVPIAEETGAIRQLGAWVLATAVEQSRRWRASFPHRRLGMSVNVSARQFTDPSLLNRLDAIEFEAGTLTLEITETALLEHGNAANAVLEGLSARGVRLSLDDFGTGFSSLTFVARLPVAELKIDRSFTANICGATREAAIARSVLHLAQALDVPVIAEGVETPEQLAWLRTQRCTSAQGYLFSPALDAASATALLQDDPRW